MDNKKEIEKTATPKVARFWKKQAYKQSEKTTHYKNLYHGMSWYSIILQFIIGVLILKIYL